MPVRLLLFIKKLLIYLYRYDSLPELTFLNKFIFSLLISNNLCTKNTFLIYFFLTKKTSVLKWLSFEFIQTSFGLTFL